MGGSFETIRGGCHCNNLRFAFDWPEPASAIPVRACSCGLCSKHGAVWTSHPQGRFSLAIGDEDRVSRYRFGTRTADFHLCRTCGVLPIAICSIAAKRYAVVNVHSFDAVDRQRLVERVTNFEGETTGDRLARRQKSWTPEAAGPGPERS